MEKIEVDQIIQGDCLDILEAFPDNSVDVIFADPPYFLQLQHDLWRPDNSMVDAVHDPWDQFADYPAYDDFSRRWLTACRRVLKETGTLWVIGTYHNIYRIGSIMQDLGYWFLNDIVWVKSNPMPNFRGVRFTNAHETLLWASKFKGAKYTFNYQAMKSLNEELQERSDWYLPICTGPERIKENGKKVHSTQKPEGLLYRIVMASSRPGEIILDPFFGSGTTGAVAKKLHRHWIGIEKDERYIRIAINRIAKIELADDIPDNVYSLDIPQRRKRRIPFGILLEQGLLKPGQKLFYREDPSLFAFIRTDGKLIHNQTTGSIHQLARYMSGGNPVNGWDAWFFEDETGELKPINLLRLRISENGLQ